jgi:mono/diheme cytochrome c family protein
MKSRHPRDQRSPSSARIPVLVLSVLLASLALPLTAAQEETSAKYVLFNKGSVSYQRYCANCHGTKAKGDGQVARLLTVKPPDLTQLAIGNGGEFPEEEVRKVIDGRKGVLGHGMRDMPIWGDVFRDDEEGPEAEAKVEQKLDELVAYLKGIQEK